ncbi:MAG: hypothetical protein R3F65_32055, partial [bacterium]
ARVLDPGRGAPVVRLRGGDHVLLRIAPPSTPATVDVDPRAPLPDLRPLRTADGRAVGPRREAVWSVPADPSRVTLTVDGGDALVRVTHGRIRPLIDEAFDDASVADALARARAALVGHTDPASARARLLVEGTADAAETCGAAVDDAPLAAWAAVRCLGVEPDDARFDAIGATLDDAEPVARELIRQLRVDAAGLAEDAGRDPSGLLPEPLPDDPLGGHRPPVDPRGFGAARAEEGWRRDPTSGDARAAALRTWYRSRWRTVPPTAAADGSPRPARRWLVVGLDPRPDEEDLGRLTPLAPGQALTVTLPAPPPGSSSRLGLVVERPPAATPSIEVGEARWTLAPGAAVEPLTVAMPGGDHRVALAGPAGVRMWVDGDTDGPGSARVARGWPVTGADGPLTLALEPTLARRRLKLALRAVGVERTVLTVQTDIGPAYAVALTFGGADPDARVLDGGGVPSRAVEVIVDLPPTTGGVTLASPDGAALLVRPALRVPSGGEATPAPAPTDGAAPRRADPLAAVGSTSRLLAADPRAINPRVQRAHRLLDLDLPLLARADVQRLHALPATPDLDRLLARFDAARDPDVLPMPAAAPVPLDPILVPHGSPDLARVTAAHRHRLAGDPWAAARAHYALWLDTHTVGAARATLTDLRAALDAPERPRGAAALAFGLITRLDDTGPLTGVRGLRGPAAAGSRWLTLDTVEGSGGYEELVLPARSPFETVAAQAREAMLAAHWPADEIHALRPGRGAVLSLRLDRPAAVTAEVWCAVEIERRGCPITLRRGAEVTRLDAPAGEVSRYPLAARAADRLAAEVVLERGGAPAAAVRFVADRPIGDETRDRRGAHVIVPRRDRRVFRALPARPVQLTVVGPGALRVEGWRPADGGASALTIAIDGPAGATEHTLPLATGADYARGDGARPLRVGETRRIVIPLADDGPHQIRLRPTGGEALVRAAVRVDVDGRAARHAPLPRAVPAFDSIGALPTTLRPPEATPLAPIGDLGTLSLRLSALQTVLDDDDGDDDAGDSRPPLVGELSAAWRRFYPGPRMHLMAGPALRTGPDAESVAGGRGRLRLDGVGPGFGLELAGQGWTALGDDGWSARASLTGWRSLRLAPDWLLTPSLRLWAGRIAESPALDPTGATAVDPILTTGWRRDHPYGARLGASLRWQMLREQHLRARLDALSNADFASVDRVDATVSWQALWGLTPTTTLTSLVRYRPSLRFADDDRAEGGLAHALATGLELGWWLDGDTRLVGFGEFRPFLGLDGDLSPRFVLGVGVDFTGGRRLVDFTPIEEPYPDLAGRVFWAPPREVER